MNTLRTMCALALLVAPAAALDVLHVPGDYGDVSSAIAAAADGDVILIAPGQYLEAPVIDGKSLVLQALPGGTVHLRRLSIVQLAPSQSVLVRGLDFDVTNFASFPGEGPLLVLTDNGGSVRLEDVDAQWSLFTTHGDWHGVLIQNCASVSLRNCKVRGADGIFLKDNQTQIGGPGNGGDGIRVTSSTLALFSCTIRAGDGGSAIDGGYDGGTGGTGVHSDFSRVFLSGCSATGGNAGHFDCSVSGCGAPGSPGPGMTEGLGAGTTWLRNVVLTGGAAISGGNGPGYFSYDGEGAVHFGAAHREFSASSPATSGHLLNLTFEGEAGDAVLVLLSPTWLHLMKTAYEGPLLVGPSILQFAVGSLPGAAPFTVPVVVPPLPVGLDAFVVPLQSIFIADGKALLGPASATVLLSPGA